MSRPLYEIATDIRSDWSKAKGGINYAAKPYLDAMGSLTSVTDSYGADGGRSIVARFLGNAGSYRGDKAKALKAELKAALAGK